MTALIIMKTLYQIYLICKFVPTAECPKEYGVFPNPANCTTFYLCSGGEHHLQECPGGLHYDVHNVRCNFPGEARCEGKKEKPKIEVKPAASNAMSAKQKPSRHCPKLDGIYSNPTNCSTFYFCVGGTAFLQECPTGLAFDGDNLKCDRPAVVGCTQKVSTTNVSQPKTQKKQKPSRHCPKLDGIFSNPTNCSTFYFCVGGTAFLQECPTGLVFDGYNLKCDRPAVVGCTPPSGTVSVLRCPEPDGVFRHPIECGTFYLCRKGRAYQYECPVGLVFDYNHKRCDYKRNVKCPEHYLERRKHQNHYMKKEEISISENLT
ncbi:hypothetical protein JTE90_015662 [Oedothorax gibbosus]|uniref:Chitin-binding type-2 domain-containing protein n=1 Tax=Oedothorax gibbosus TaxID=931172 RepID=A0AAV6UIA8_9ARAC|nr:hypothetical protein JTE90_015662 [Oedothorax gibbosus]